ncbi:MAG: helix-turn-helix transcriptional regulator [Candidatus Humimicrobiaceae bacterium]
MITIMKNNLNSIIKEKGIKKGYLAKRLGVTNQTMSNWLSGYSMPNLLMAKKLSAMLEVTIEDIFFDNNINISADIDKMKQKKRVKEINT